MKHKLKRVLSVALALTMGLSSISTSALATESDLQTEQAIEADSVELGEITLDVAEETQEEEADAAAEEEAAEDSEEAGTEPAEEAGEADDAGEPADDEKTEEDAEEEAAHVFDADIVLNGKSSDADMSKAVNIQAYADEDEDTYGYIFFWQYDGTFPDNASAWAAYFTQSYDGITIDGYDSDFGGLYLPVTLEDGSSAYADAQKGTLNGTVYLAFTMPAGSTMDTDLSFGTSDDVEEDLYVMLEAAYADTDRDILQTTDYLPLTWLAEEKEEAEEAAAEEAAEPGELEPFDGEEELTEENSEAEATAESNKDEAEAESEEMAEEIATLEAKLEEDDEFEEESEADEAEQRDGYPAKGSLVSQKIHVWAEDLYFDFAGYSVYGDDVTVEPEEDVDIDLASMSDGDQFEIMYLAALADDPEYTWNVEVTFSVVGSKDNATAGSDEFNNVIPSYIPDAGAELGIPELAGSVIKGYEYTVYQNDENFYLESVSNGYDTSKFRMSVVDDGGFDVAELGDYTVRYSVSYFMASSYTWYVDSVIHVIEAEENVNTISLMADSMRVVVDDNGKAAKLNYSVNYYTESSEFTVTASPYNTNILNAIEPEITLMKDGTEVDASEFIDEKEADGTYIFKVSLPEETGYALEITDNGNSIWFMEGKGYSGSWIDADEDKFASWDIDELESASYNGTIPQTLSSGSTSLGSVYASGSNGWTSNEWGTYTTSVYYYLSSSMQSSAITYIEDTLGNTLSDSDESTLNSFLSQAFSISCSSAHSSVGSENKAGWTSVTQFPISVTLTVTDNGNDTISVRIYGVGNSSESGNYQRLSGSNTKSFETNPYSITIRKKYQYRDWAASFSNVDNPKSTWALYKYNSSGSSTSLLATKTVKDSDGSGYESATFDSSDGVTDGHYMLVETSNSGGWVYKYITYDIVLTESNPTWEPADADDDEDLSSSGKYVVNKPYYYNGNILLKLNDIGEKLEGFTFKVQYWTGNPSSSSSTNEMTWYFVTDANGQIKLHEDYISTASAYKGKSDDIPRRSSSNTYGSLPYGYLTIQEVAVGDTRLYDVDDTVYPVELKRVTDENDADYGTILYNDPTIENPRKLGWIYVQKIFENTSVTDGNSMYSREGAEYTVYTDAACTKVAEDAETFKNMVLVTDKNGLTGLGAYYPDETLYVKETKASPGCEKDPNVYSVTIEPGEEIPVRTSSGNAELEEPQITYGFDITIEKEIEDDYQTDMSLAGGVFKFEFYAGKTSASGNADSTWYFETQDYETGKAKIELSSGYLSTDYTNDKLYYNSEGEPCIPLGTLVVTEEYPPEGFNAWEGTNTYVFLEDSYTLNGTSYPNTGKVSMDIPQTAIAKEGVTVYDALVFGGLDLYKIDSAMEDGSAQGTSTLAGATFEIVNENDYTVCLYTDPETSYKKGEVVMTITTDEDGYATTGSKMLQYGYYSVRESESSYGYWLDNSFEGEAYIHDDDVTVSLGDDIGYGEEHTGGWEDWHGYFVNTNAKDFDDVTVTYQEDKVNQIERRSDLAFEKIDIDGNSFPYLPFMISAYDKDGNLIEQHAVVSDANGWVSTASKSYNSNTHSYDDCRPHSNNMNVFDQYVVDGKVTAEGQKLLDQSADGTLTGLDNVASWGIWFQGKQDDEGTPNDSYGALYTAYYQITEIQCDANADREENLLWSELLLIENTTGEYTEVIIDNADMHQYDPFVNTEIYLKSTAQDFSSGSKTIAESDSTEVQDTVSYDHVSSDKTYRMETKFVDITAGNENVPIAGTNDPDASVKSDDFGSTWVVKEFQPEKRHSTTTTDGTITMTAVLDTTGRCGHVIVAVDYLYEFIENADGSGTWIRVARHEDYDDSDQMVYVPDLHTSAVDGITGDRTGDKTADDYIIDSVEYSNLSRGMDYYITMEIVDADTGESINGTVVTTEIHKSGSLSSLYGGDVVMPEYDIDSSDFDGDRTLVVVEKLYLANEDGEDTLLVDHNSLLDEDQSVHYPDIHTTASDSETADHVGTVDEAATVYDEVVLTNIVFDDDDHEDGSPYTYTVTGGLVYKSDFTDADGVSHKAGDEVPTLEGTYDTVTITCDASGNATFTYPDGTEAKGSVSNMHYGYNTGKTVNSSDVGNNIYVEDKKALIADVTVELIYKIDSSILEGTTVVVFEDLYHNDVLIGTHHDIDDEEQAIHYPKVRTSAKDTATDSNVGYVYEDDTIVDTVILTNLIPGMSYTVTGRLMNQEDGKALVINGQTFEVSADIYVTEDGEIIAPNGEAVTTTNYDAALNQVDGTVDLTFNIDASGLEAMTAVVFEKLIHNSVEVAQHEDITDHDQSVYYPMIWSEAWDGDTLDHVGTIEGDDFLYDTVFLKNLKIGEEYTVYGVLYNKDTGEAILDPDGNLMTQSATFIAGETSTKSATEHGSAEGHAEDVEDLVIPITITNRNDEYGYVDCEFVLAIPIDSTDFEGITAVIVETLSYAGLDITSDYEYAMETEYQTLHYPVISTSAVDTTTGSKLGAVPGEGESTDIHDDITIDNLVEEMEYVLRGVLVDLTSSDIENGVFNYIREDGTLTDNIDEAYTQVIEFTAEQELESFEMDFILATDKIQGMTILVLQDLYHNDVMVDAHPEEYSDGWHVEDLYDEAVYYPALKTNATDNVTDEHISDANGTRTVEDRVWFENLLVGDTYTITGELVYQSDFVDADGVEHYAGESVTGESKSVTFVADAGITSVPYDNAEEDDDSAAVFDSVNVTELITGQEVVSGYVTLSFEVDTSKLAGATLVVFEDLYSEGVDVCPHHNLRDYPQTIKIPKIGTSALVDGIDEAAIYNEDGSFRDIVITDTVKYENLWTAEELQTMHEQGLDLIYLDGTLRDGGNAIFDINESAMYTLKGVLMDKETGEPLVNENGETYVVFTEAFTPSSANGSIDVEFVLNGADFMNGDECVLEGKNVVVFEYLYVADNPDDCTDDRETAFHEDIEDTEQDIRFPRGRTHATDTADAIEMAGSDYVDAVIMMHESDASTTAHEVLADGSVSITDMFAFENLHGATVYTVTATLQKITGYNADGTPSAWEPACDDEGNVITATVTLDTSIYSDDYEDSVSGYIPIVFEFSGKNLAGSTTVVFENIYRNGQAVLVHADITDEAQTVVFPKIGTNASDAVSGTSEMLAAGKSYILDKVSYEDLEYGKEYTLKAVMYDQESGLQIEDASAEGKFVAGAADQVILPSGTYTMTLDEVLDYLGGATTLTDWNANASADSYATAQAGSSSGFASGAYETGGSIGNRVNGDVWILVEIDTSWLEGHTIVAFETLYGPEGNIDKEIAEHKDIDDEGQSVHVLSIGTTAMVDNGASTAGTVHVDDKVEYSNLTPDQEYKVRGVIMDKTAGTSLGIYGETVFTPEDESGEVDVYFDIDVSSLGGHTLVVFEELLTEDGNGDSHIVAEHKDIDDEGQSIIISESGKPSTPAVKTGDDFNPIPLIVIAAIIVILIIAGIALTRRKKTQGAPKGNADASVEAPKEDKPEEPKPEAKADEPKDDSGKDSE